MKMLVTAMIMLALVAPVQAYCSDPSAPYSKPSKPMTPFCINELMNTHTCSNFEIDMYNSEIDRFNSDLRRYIDDLQTYLDEAQEYAKCEIEELTS